MSPRRTGATCNRAPAGWFCSRAPHDEGACILVKLAPAPLPDRIDSQPVSTMDAHHVGENLGETVQSLPPVVTHGGPPINMGRTPCPPAISTEDPRLLTCCLAIEPPGPGSRGRVCHDTRMHEDPLHDWERAF